MDKEQIKQFKKECAEAERELREEIVDFKKLEKWIIKHIGKRCKTYACGCYCCDVWHGYDAIRSLVDF